MPREHYLFVTGRLAEQSLRDVVGVLARREEFDSTVCVLPITIAALMTPKWIARHIEVPPGITRVMVPGFCGSDLEPLEAELELPVVCGPRDVRQLPEFFGHRPDRAGYGQYDIEILAEVLLTADRTDEEIRQEAAQLTEQGADYVVLRPDGDLPESRAADVIRLLRADGRHVAVIDLACATWIDAARAGAEMILGVSVPEISSATDLGVEPVINSPAPDSLDGLDPAIQELTAAGASFRIDLELAPIGLGLAESVAQCIEARERWPDAELVLDTTTFMEQTGVDSAGMNLLLLGLCQELGIRSVRTAQHSNWTRSCVRECHLARQLVHFAFGRAIPPGQLESGLLMLRDERVLQHGPEGLAQLASMIQDPSPRIFAEDGRLHAIQCGEHFESDEPYDLFDRLEQAAPRPFTTAQSFYFGYEMSKAVTALALGKTYRQDEALDWGMLTVREMTRLERRMLRMSRGDTRSQWDDPCPDEKGDA